ncbi:MAG: TetR/AcrR family transcriptional regulator [Clostridia bacterium]|nr:TetR/AcrR family transcriptional regulator [Clostridia bacterium]
MPRDKTQSHNRIVDAAKKEFLEYGFADASLRRIASGADIQVSGIYKHFANKEEMFASLVDPVIDGLLGCMQGIEDDYISELDRVESDGMWKDQSEPVKSMMYIYEHFDEFKLLICKSQGTRYESFTHDLAKLEEEATVRYMKALKKRKIRVKKVDEKEFHLLVTASIEAVFQAVIHDFTREEAMHYAQTLELFYLPAWKALFGI